ncbi:MAG TPA: methyltransferase domain-containing protein [Anaerolineae bacterium]|jgi:SAM-dependent methyltransferase
MKMHFASYYRWLVFSFLFEADGFPPETSAPILDVGSKRGEFLQRFTSPQKVALDIKPELLPRDDGTLLRVVADAACLPVRAQTFGYVLMNDVIEHVQDDRSALRGAALALAPGGYLWLSTPAVDYAVGPEFITRRFERAWGHVRRGYRPETLAQAFGPGFNIRTVLWPEPLVRLLQTPLWALSRVAMPVARWMARACFDYDRHVYLSGNSTGSLNGHIYISAQRNL